MVEHHFYILYNQLYSVKYILWFVLTKSMFIYLIWKNQQGESLKAMFEEAKASLMADQMRIRGVTVELQPADIPINNIKVT